MTTQLPVLLGRLQRWLEHRPWLLQLVGAAGVLTLIFLQFRHVTLDARLAVPGGAWYWLDDDQMISMRYARNLAQGHGLTWNPGEYVEGYSNLLWTLLMAAVHALGASDGHAALWIHGLSALLDVALVVLALRFASHFVVLPALAQVALALSLAACMDVAYWATQGFETTLLQVTVLLVLDLQMCDHRRGQVRWLPYAIASLLPLIRADALGPWLLVAALAHVQGKRQRKVYVYLGLSLLPAALHLLWRHQYYGAWLPNTFAVKVLGLQDRSLRAVGYLQRCVGAYGLPWTLALLASLRRADIRARNLLLVGGAALVAYVLATGGDGFSHCRFAAWLVPPVFALAFVAAVQWQSKASWPVLALTAVIVLQSGVVRGGQLDSGNGVPLDSARVAYQLKQRAPANSSVAVIAAGIVPYFTGFRAIDALGKCDATVAHLPARQSTMIGHGKFNGDWTLRSQPDFVISVVPAGLLLGALRDAQMGRPLPQPEHRYLLAESRIFAGQYADNGVPMPPTVTGVAVFAQRESLGKLKALLQESPR